MPKYRKKPVVIEAVRWDGTSDCMAEIHALAKDCGRKVYRGWNDTLTIPTPEGDMYATTGAWIIRGVQGEVYPCKPDIFEATYELVEE